MDAIKDAREALAARRKALADEIGRVDKAIAALDNVMGAPVQSRTRRRRGRVGVIKPALAEVLKERAPQDMHADEIRHAIEERGIPLSAKDPKATIVTALIRMDAERRETGNGEGVEKLGGNRFRWVTAETSEPEPLSVRSRFVAPESASQPEPSHP